MKKKVIIIDDDPNGVELLKQYLASHTLHLELAGCAGNCLKGEKLIRAVDPDLVLLDIEMPDGSGFDLLRNVSEHVFHCVIITAFEKFAIPAFDADALHFLCKPVGKEKFDMALLRFYQRNSLLAENKKNASLTGSLPDEQKMKIPSLNGYEIVEIKEIVRLQANGSYTEIYFISGNKMLTSKHLKAYEEILRPMGFVRIQKSHLVNTAYVKSIRKGKKGILVLKDGTHLYFSNTYRTDILSHFFS